MRGAVVDPAEAMNLLQQRRWREAGKKGSGIKRDRACGWK